MGQAMADGNSRDEKYKIMTETPVERLVCRLAVPTVVSMLISALYNMADTYFVGTLGTSATASVGVVFSLMAMIQAIGFFFGHGAGNYISRQLGAQQFDKAAKMAATGFFSALLAGTVLAALGTIFMEPFARLLGASDTMLEYTCQYLRFILIGAPWMCGTLVLNNLLRFQGSAFYGMIGMTSGAVLNIGLDPLFIYVLDLGVGGAALATMISQLAGCCILLAGCARGGNIPVHPKNFSPSRQAYKEMVRGGTPSLCRQGLAGIAAICMNQVAGGFGDAAIAAISIVNRVTMFASSALIGYGQGFQPVCGFNYGAKRYDRVYRAFWFCVKSSFLVLLLLAVAGFIYAPRIVWLFRRDDAEVIRIGALALRLQCVTFPLMGWVIMNNMMLQTIGLAGKASLLALARQGLFLLPALFLLTPWLGIVGIQMSQPVSDFCTFLLSVPLGLGVLAGLKREAPPEG